MVGEATEDAIVAVVKVVEVVATAAETALGSGGEGGALYEQTVIGNSSTSK